MPLHLGHEYLINFAKQYVDNLYVIVDHLEGETIDVKTRVNWLKEQIPDIKIIGLKIKTPQQPSEHPDFWNFWSKLLIDSIGQKPDCLIAAMDYGYTLSKYLNCNFIECDIARESFNISATQIRDDLTANWDFLTNSVKASLTKRIAFVGPESTGKSTCAQNIAQHFNTIYVPEYAKAIIKHQNNNFYKKNIKQFMLGQVNSENVLARNSKQILICDTDSLTTLVWSKMIFNYEPSFLLKSCQKNKYYLTFLFDIDVPFVNDYHRQILLNPAELKVRKNFLKQFEFYLQKFNRPYKKVSGNYQQRFNLCKSEIEKLIKI